MGYINYYHVLTMGEKSLTEWTGKDIVYEKNNLAYWRIYSIIYFIFKIISTLLLGADIVTALIISYTIPDIYKFISLNSAYCPQKDTSLMAPLLSDYLCHNPNEYIINIITIITTISNF
jgi:hypothetical protein